MERGDCIQLLRLFDSELFSVIGFYGSTLFTAFLSSCRCVKSCWYTHLYKFLTQWCMRFVVSIFTCISTRLFRHTCPDTSYFDVFISNILYPIPNILYPALHYTPPPPPHAHTHTLWSTPYVSLVLYAYYSPALTLCCFPQLFQYTGSSIFYVDVC